MRFELFVTIYFVFLFHLLTNSIEAEPTEIIETDKGPVRGEILKTIQEGVEYASFKGIPYATPPIGYRRFQPPEEAATWTKVIEAVKDPNKCPQKLIFYEGDEDCLYLNVYTPKIKSNDTNLRAVMVWIYGGAFIVGDISGLLYGPDFLIEDDVVVVAMNYRLGAFGFLSLNHPNVTGNAGLKDQNLALKWVQKNIEKFGGDPTKVTIFGESAGAASVELHKLSDRSRGLFNNSIAMSGSPLNFWGLFTTEEAEAQAFKLGEQLGINTTDKNELLNYFYTVDAEELVNAVIKAANNDLPMKPTIEKANVGPNSFLTDCPVDRYMSGNFAQLPHMLGFTSDEALLFIETTLFKQFWNNKMEFQSIEEATEWSFIAGIDRTQQYLTTKGTAPVYYYRNSFDYPESLHRQLGSVTNGTAHGDDIFHIFSSILFQQPLEPDLPITLHRKRMVRMWTNFAKTGNPTPLGEQDKLLKVTWPESGEEGKCLNLDIDFTVIPRPVIRSSIPKALVEC